MDYVNRLSPLKNNSSAWHRWQVQGQESNFQFINFVEKYMREWTGYAYETAFDVNVLAIDETTVCVIGSDPTIIKQLNNRGIKCITIPWRHRFFVDCGLHCLTLDLDRDSSQTV
jgi:N-dimethylarginine dimethylaminohydrolase